MSQPLTPHSSPNDVSTRAHQRFVNFTSHWRHNGRDYVSNHQPHHCLLNRLFRRRSKKTSKLRVTGLCSGNSPGSVNSPHEWPVTRKILPFDDVIMKPVLPDWCNRPGHDECVWSVRPRGTREATRRPLITRKDTRLPSRGCYRHNMVPFQYGDTLEYTA